MPKNWIADKLEDEHAKVIPVAGALRIVRQTDINNFAARLETQTSKLSGGSRAAQGAIANTLVNRRAASRPDARRQYNPTAAPPPPAAQTPSGQQGGVKVVGGGLSAPTRRVRVLYRFRNTKIVGQQTLEITTEIWLLSNGQTETVTSTRVIGQNANRPR